MVLHVRRIVIWLSGSIDISRGAQLHKDLCQATESLVVSNHLHLLYLVTPYHMVDNVKIQWMVYLDEVRDSIIPRCM